MDPSSGKPAPPTDPRETPAATPEDEAGAATKTALRVSLNDTKDRLRIEARSGQTATLLTLELDDEAVSHLLDAIAHKRAQMTPKVPERLQGVRQVLGLGRPRWVVSTIESGSISLAIRHPGLGWLRFVFPASDARAIADYIVKPRPPKNLQ